MPLSFYHSLGGDPGKYLVEIVQEYNKSHATQVELTYIANDYAAAAKEALARAPADRPNFILAPEFMTPAMNSALKERVVLSMNSLLDKERLGDIAEIVKRTFGTDSLPFNPACGVLYINKTLLEKAGFSADWSPETLEDLVAASKTVVEKSEAPFGYTCAWPEAYLVEVVLAQKNLGLVDSDNNYNFLQLKEHILHLRDLVKSKVFSVPDAGNYDSTRKAFVEGKVAFYMQGSGHYGLIEKEAKFDLGVSALPTLSDRQTEKYAFPLGGAAIWVFNKEGTSETAIDDVKEFLNYISSVEVQCKWHEKTAYVPVSNSARQALKEFHKTHPLHEAVVKQTIGAPLGENSFGIKKSNYHLVRPKIYPFIRELLLLDGDIEQRLIEFQNHCNSL